MSDRVYWLASTLAAFFATRFSKDCKRFSIVARSMFDIARNLHDTNWDNMEIEVKNNPNIIGDGTNFRTVIDKRTRESVFHLAEKDGLTHIWSNKMVPIAKIKEALSILESRNLSSNNI